MPLVSTGQRTASLTALICSRSAGPLRRCAQWPRTLPCTAIRSHPAASSCLQKISVSSRVSWLGLGLGLGFGLGLRLGLAEDQRVFVGVLQHAEAEHGTCMAHAHVMCMCMSCMAVHVHMHMHMHEGSSRLQPDLDEDGQAHPARERRHHPEHQRPIGPWVGQERAVVS